MTPNSPTRELRYVVYLPDGPTANPYPFHLSGEAEVLDLEDQLRNHPDFKRTVENESVKLFKCGALASKSRNRADPAGERYKEAINWLGVEDNIKKNLMNPLDALKEYFPSGPITLKKKKKIDVIVVTDSIIKSVLGEPVASEYSSDTSRHPDILAHGWVLDPAKDWQKFYGYWLKQDYVVESRKDLITLVLDDKGYDDNEHRLSSIPRSCNRLYVRPWYRKLVTNICDFKEAWKRKGVILSGQPGTGKTTWLWFMLICCIMKKENVLFHYKGETRLFFEEKLYKASQNPSNRWIKDKDACIWSLIDSDVTAAPPPAYLTDSSLNLFPVQASSPNVARYSIWKKDRQAYLWGMPLWKHGELVEALKLFEDYDVFMDGLRRRLAKIASGGRHTGDCAPLSPADGGQTGASSPLTRPPTPQDDKWDMFLENAMRFAKDDKGHWKDAETVFESMVEDAIYQFGEALRDVTEAVIYGFRSLELRIRAALEECNPNLDQLLNALSAIGTGESMTSKGAASHQLFALELQTDSVMKMWDDQFVPKFRSDPIGKRVMEKVGRLAFVQARKFLGVFKNFPESSSFAGWIFESIAHHKLSAGSVPSRIYCMELDDTTKARAVYKCLPEETRSTSFQPQMREYVTVTFENNELIWKVSEPIENLLCVPSTANNPFFDSFFVDMDVTEDSVKATIWIVQVTISKSHDGSKGGFPLINSVKKLVEKRAEELRSQKSSKKKRKRSSQKRVVSVDLKYLLICPGPITPRKWNFPRDGFQTDIQGDVFCMHVEVAVF